MAHLHAEHWSEIVGSLAALTANDNRDNGNFKERLPVLLWELSYQFDFIAGLLEIGEEAEYRLNKLEKPPEA